jgi:cytochrome c
MTEFCKLWFAGVVALGALFVAAGAARGGGKGDAVAGRSAFEKRCTGCHALDHEKVGPRLGGVVGRKAGSVSNFPYSDGVKKSGLVWNEQLLDQWLSDPESVVPDNDMTFRLNNPDERAAIIAFLKETGK